MTYPYSDSLLKLLKIETTPDVYLPVRDKGQRFKRSGVDLDAILGYTHPEDPALIDYIMLLPIYKYAECPICGAGCYEPIDTYSLRPALRYELGHFSIYHQSYLVDPPCAHYAGVHSIVNYHNIFPHEIDEVRGYSEVPYVSGQLVNGVDEAYAVLHALPVCEITEDQFVPRFTLFMMTYFAVDVAPIYEKHYAEEYRGNENDPEFFPYNLVSFNCKFDLEALAKKGLLGWLDFNDEEDLPLVIGKGAKLPDIYRNIEGEKRNFHWKRYSLSYRLRCLKRNIRAALRSKHS